MENSPLLYNNKFLNTDKSYGTQQPRDILNYQNIDTTTDLNIKQNI